MRDRPVSTKSVYMSKSLGKGRGRAKEGRGRWTFIIASRTFGLVIRLLRKRLLINSAFVLPEHCQAMVWKTARRLGLKGGLWRGERE